MARFCKPCRPLKRGTHISTRETLGYFSIASSKNLAVLHHGSCMLLWSIYSFQIMNSLKWHLNCIQEQLHLTLVQLAFWRGISWTVLHWPLKVKPILLGITFDRKGREIGSMSMKKNLLAELQPSGFFCKIQYPKASRVFPTWLPSNRHQCTNGNKCHQEPKRIFQEWAKRTSILHSLVTATWKYFNCYLSVLLDN